MIRLRRSLPLGILLAALASSAHARGLPPPPNPGLEASVRGADAIAEVEILAGGTFRACAAVRRTWKGALPPVVELEGFNSFNGDTVHTGFPTGGRFILLLSNTDRPGVFATLTPSAPRLSSGEDGVLLTLGDPPLRIPVRPEAVDVALTLLLEREKSGATPERAGGVLRGWWDKNEVETRYLAVAMAGFLREPRVLELVTEASQDKLLRLRFTAIEALRGIATPEARAVLRGLLKDGRDSVAQEAAAALLALEDLEALEELLLWAKRANAAQAKLPANDSRRAQVQRVLNRLLVLVDEFGALLPRERLCPPLFELARGADAGLASDALFVLSTLAQAPQVQGLVELADDPVYAQRRAALAALARATLREVHDLDAFRAWWKEARAGFGEDQKRMVVEAAASGLVSSPLAGEQARLLNTLRMAPSEIALVSCAPLLLHGRLAARIDGQDLALWRSPLVIPFLLERLASGQQTERRAALEGLSLLARRHPRVRELALRFLRGAMGDEYSGVRRAAAAATGRLEDARAIPALLDALRGDSLYEAHEAADVLYALSARTLGYGFYEPAADQEAAARRFAGWWEGLGGSRAAWRTPLASKLPPPAPDAFPTAALEALVFDPDSGNAGAAFTRLYGARPPGAPLWLKLLESKRLRDRAHGLLGLLEGPEALAPRVQALLSGAKADADLVRAQALVVLATLQGAQGPQAVLAWLEQEGGKSEPPWRRLAIVCLGLAEGEPGSLKYLAQALERALAAEAHPARPEPDPDDPTPAAAPAAAGDAGLADLGAVLTALCAREDSSKVLEQALRSKSDRVRETVFRTLVLRRHRGTRGELLAALVKAPRTTVAELAGLAAPLLEAADLVLLRALLEDPEIPARMAAATLLASRWELAGEAQTRAVLRAATADLRPHVRARAAEALGRLRDAQSVPSLTALLRDEDSEAAACAAEALAAIGDRDACIRAVVEVRPSYRRDVRWYRALGIGAGETELAQLLQLSRSDLWAERRVGLDALGGAPSIEALARLLEVFRDPDSALQTHAADALERQGRAAVAGLAKDFESSDFATRARAYYLLARIPVKPSLERLLQALDDPDLRLRLLADWGLRKISAGKDAGFRADAPKLERQAAAQRWRTLLPPELLKE